ncbi:MAG: rubrerythrin family protein, partial [Ignisphaera sp.]
ALYTSVAYIVVVLLLALPYFILNSIATAFIAMMLLAMAIVAYMTFYTAVLHNKKFLREFAESVVLILGVSLLLYILGSVLGRAIGIKTVD